MIRCAAMFKSYLQVRHTSEDDMLWPPMRQALADDSDRVALLDAMEAEHSAIDPFSVSADWRRSAGRDLTAASRRQAAVSLRYCLRDGEGQMIGDADRRSGRGAAVVPVTKPGCGTTF
jgi:hypothetical protein